MRHELLIGDNLETLEGSIVYIRCPVTGNPAPKIEWKKSGGLISTRSSLQFMNNTLVLFDGASSDTGSYSCVATNGAGSDEKSTYLKFMGKQIARVWKHRYSPNCKACRKAFLSLQWVNLMYSN